MQVTTVAQVADAALHERELPDAYEIRDITEADQEALASLYFAAYPRDIVDDEQAATDEIDVTFAGEYGWLDLAASPVITYDGEIVASVMTVEEAPWDDTPSGPFVIEVMTHPDHRRQGLAEHALIHVARKLEARGKQTVALRVDSDNTSALDLYRKLGFV
jgi:N-alpha-acetyltransferase 10/11